MYRRAFARHRTGAALLLGLSLRAPSASAERAEPDETRVGTVEGKTAEALPSAAETPPIPAAPIVAPRLIRDEGVAYSGQALGERFHERVEVRLILELGASGRLRSSSVETPQGHGFDEAATRAARELLFEPALRAGVPVPRVPGDEARVSFALSPRVELPGVAEAARELTVRTQPSAPSVSSRAREEVRRIPGASGDPSHAEEALPSVTPVDSGLPVYVRGAPPGNAGYSLDRVRVPYLHHIGLEPSVLHPGLLDRVDLYLGGYPARFGRFTGGVVSAQTRGLEPAPSGQANVRLFDLGSLLEPTFARGRGRLLPALLSLLIPEVKLGNRDYQARATHEPSAPDRFSAFGFGSYDLLGEKRNGILTRLGDAFRPKITFTW